VTDVVLVGPGRIGLAFARAWPDAPCCGRGVAVPVARTTILCVGEEDLPAALAAVPHRARDGVVLIQNGLLAPWLARVGAAHVTRGVLYLAASARDGVAVPGGTSVFRGPRAAEVAGRLQDAFGGGVAEGISPPPPEEIVARAEDDARAYARVEAEKLGWTCAFGMLGAVGGGTVGDTLAGQGARLDLLLAELAPVLAEAVGVPIDAGSLTTSVRAYAARVAGWRARPKALAWRNGALLAVAERAGLPDTLHASVVAEAGLDVAVVRSAARALLYSPP
jgi:hypothetical protein